MVTPQRLVFVVGELPQTFVYHPALVVLELQPGKLPFFTGTSPSCSSFVCAPVQEADLLAWAANVMQRTDAWLHAPTGDTPGARLAALRALIRDSHQLHFAPDDTNARPPFLPGLGPDDAPEPGAGP